MILVSFIWWMIFNDLDVATSLIGRDAGRCLSQRTAATHIKNTVVAEQSRVEEGAWLMRMKESRGC